MPNTNPSFSLEVGRGRRVKEEFGVIIDGNFLTLRKPHHFEIIKIIAWLMDMGILYYVMACVCKSSPAGVSQSISRKSE